MQQPTRKTFILTPYFLALVSPAAVGSPRRASADGGWTFTCEGKAVTTTGVLSGNCFRGDQGQVCSRLDLNHCYGFGRDDKVHEQDDGNFMTSCHNCYYSFQFGGGIVECTCDGHDGLPLRVDLRTDNIVTNNGGYLECFGHVAEPC
ncbi:hypothetical protein F5X99DRAFT_408926 [Biscogniauxia marginata]|nr:hypothetical protein F5X99DRAFT_408926 [Biscogniauxia marginata]